MGCLDWDQLRSDAIARLAERPLDLLVVGGGIVGAGVARDAAMRGLRTGLVEQHDLAFGTSSRSSRLLHGGIRYLAQGRLGLVHEASREKGVLWRIAPALGRAAGLLLSHLPQDALAAMETADRREGLRFPLRRPEFRTLQRDGPGHRPGVPARPRRRGPYRRGPLLRRSDQRFPARAGHASLGGGPRRDPEQLHPARRC